MAQTARGAASVPQTTPSNGILTGGATPAANRKKQKRKAKQAAARQAVDQPQQPPGGYPLDTGARNGHVSQGHSTMQHPMMSHQPAQPRFEYHEAGFDDPSQYPAVNGDEPFFSDEDGQLYAQGYESGLASPNGHIPGSFDPPLPSASKSKKKKKRNKSVQVEQPFAADPYLNPSHVPPPPPLPPLATTTKQAPRKGKSDPIWNTSTTEERERIKEFWLNLGEEDRKGLVKLEKEQVLKKMKEQQRYSCSCTVCGRKRTAIEEELEVLYDAYYEELEQYANGQQDHRQLPPPRVSDLGPVPTMRRTNHPPASHAPPGRFQEEELDDEDVGSEDELYDEDESGDYDDDEEPQDIPPGIASDFLNFGNSLTVKGGILTVADDLLKNDGKKFIEMMEQLAERRIQREDLAFSEARGIPHPHSHHHGYSRGYAPPPEDDEFEGDEEDDYDDEDDEDYDTDGEEFPENVDEMEGLSEEQRMEEGRRMFQIFAARMFEQRVYSAYQEKTAEARREKLLEELEDEEQAQKAKEEKKARDAEKKKKKKDAQKQAKAEEKRKKDEAKAAEEAAVKEAEAKKQEEARKRKEEQRLKKEAERKKVEDEKQRKEAEKQKRVQEEREKQQEAQRKLAEQKAQDKKAKEEQKKKKEREEREAKEKEIRDKKAQEEKEKKQREAENKAREAKSKTKNQGPTAQAPTIAKRSSQQTVVALPGNLQSKSGPNASPVATPALPKAPAAGNRPRQQSQTASHGSSPQTPQIGTAGTSKPSSPRGAVNVPATTVTPKTAQPKQLAHQSSNVPPVNAAPAGQPPSPLPLPANISIPLPQAQGFPGMVPLNMPAFSPPQSSLPLGPAPRGGAPPFGQQMPPPGSQPRGFAPPGFPNALPGMPSQASGGPGRGFPLDSPPGFPPSAGMGGVPGASSFGVTRDFIPSHSRQSSATDRMGIDLSGAQQPISRPQPIQRPSSTKPGRNKNSGRSSAEVDNLTDHLGSSALIGDDDEDDDPSLDGRGRVPSGGAPGLGHRTSGGLNNFGASPLFPDTPGARFGFPGGPGSNWTSPSMGFGGGSGISSAGWGPSPGMPGSGWPHPSNPSGHSGSQPMSGGFGAIGSVGGSSIPRPQQVRLMVCQACKQLSASRPAGSDTFHLLEAVLQHLNLSRMPSQQPPSQQEVMDIIDTEGTPQNGGGIFNTRTDNGRLLIEYMPDNNSTFGMHRGSSGLGEIGSPLPGGTMSALGGPIGRGFGTSGGF